MIDQINELPEDGLKSLPETSRHTENTWFSRKIKISCTFLHLTDLIYSKNVLFRLQLENRVHNNRYKTYVPVNFID